MTGFQLDKPVISLTKYGLCQQSSAMNIEKIQTIIINTVTAGDGLYLLYQSTLIMINAYI